MARNARTYGHVMYIQHAHKMYIQHTATTDLCGLANFRGTVSTRTIIFGGINSCQLVRATFMCLKVIPFICCLFALECTLY